jgi:LEA14-like dessication related protein
MPGSAKLFSPLFLLSIAMPILLTGCAFLNLDKTRPSVSLTGLKLEEIKAMETVFMLDLQVSNPADSTMKIRSLNYTLKINGALFAAGMSDQQIEISPFGSAQVQVMLYASDFEQVSSVIQFLQEKGQEGDSGKMLQYDLSGTIHLDKFWGKKIPFQAGGKLVQD